MDVKLPNLGEGADSGTVVNLFVKEGDQIEKDQPLLELENEKAVASIPSTAAGVITKIFVKTGDKISVGQRIVAVADAEGGASAAPAAAAQPRKQAPAKQTRAPRRSRKKRKQSRRRDGRASGACATAKSPPRLPSQNGERSRHRPVQSSWQRTGWSHCFRLMSALTSQR